MNLRDYPILHEIKQRNKCCIVVLHFSHSRILNTWVPSMCKLLKTEFQVAVIMEKYRKLLKKNPLKNISLIFSISFKIMDPIRTYDILNGLLNLHCLLSLDIAWDKTFMKIMLSMLNLHQTNGFHELALYQTECP